MKKDDDRAVGVGRLKLGQGRFKNGALYISAILTGGELSAVDFRFFVEEEQLLTPTPKGFRVHQSEFRALVELFRENPENVGEVTLWSSGSRSLLVRRCDDEYGKGIDFRYFKRSPTYEGWEKRGIRLRDDDFAKLGVMALATRVMDIGWGPCLDLFDGKRFIGRSRGPGEERAGGAVGQRANRTGTPVSDALAQFLSDD